MVSHEANSLARTLRKCCLFFFCNFPQLIEFPQSIHGRHGIQIQRHQFFFDAEGEFVYIENMQLEGAGDLLYLFLYIGRFGRFNGLIFNNLIRCFDVFVFQFAEAFLGAFHECLGHACHACNVYTEGVVGAAGDQFAQKHHFMSDFAGADVKIVDARQFFGEFI